MRFGPVPVDAALGTILAHSQAVPGGRLRKGRVLEAEDVARLRAAGLTEVTVARLDPGDWHEDAAAAHLAAALVGDASGLRLTAAATGRVNVYAEAPGLLRLDRAAVDGFNGIDPMITVATLPPLARVAPRTMVATIKIIAYGVGGDAVAAAAAAGEAGLSLAPVALRSAGLIVTAMDAGPGDGKGRKAVSDRLAALGMDLAAAVTVPHEAGAIARALADLPGELALILTASATSDPEDVAPSAVRAAGGTVTRFGMPVDPGNLLFLGEAQGRPVIGLPGCARSPALNGADWVLERVACAVPVGGAEIAAMGVGGLLKESPARPAPRARAAPG
ncbi:molybdopterin biosynthesis protein [Rhodobacteraceae bacterium CCMM004]|nr:molybdopterin biosynthesis protein [Rhodobacteraceae bacterium CCMM004]